MAIAATNQTLRHSVPYFLMDIVSEQSAMSLMFGSWLKDSRFEWLVKLVGLVTSHTAITVN